MTLEDYDKAVLNYFKSIWENTIFTEDTDVLKTSANDNLQRVKFPIISIFRTDQNLADEISNDNQYRYGAYNRESDNLTKGYPCNINYQLDIMSNRRRDVDLIWRELIYYIKIKNYLYAEYEGEKYGAILQIEDTSRSTDADFTEQGRIHRQTINIILRDAYIFFTKKVPLVEQIDVRVCIINEDGEVTEEITIEPQEDKENENDIQS